MSAIDVTSAAALQDYAQDFYSQLSKRMYYDFKSINHASVIEGVKGRLILTDLKIGDLVKRSSVNFAPIANVVKFRPRVLITETVDIDLEINPKAFAKSYLESLKSKGQNNNDIPFEGQVWGGIANKVNSEFEIAFWRAEQAATPMAGDPLKKVFNGALKLFKTMRLEGHTPVPVPGGAYTVDNIVKHFDDMFSTLDPEAKEFGVETFCSWKNMNLYIQGYKKENNSNMPMVKRNAAGVINAVEMNNGTGWVYYNPGFGTSDFVVMTQKGNMIWGTDDINDAKDFKVVEDIKSIKFTTAARIGMQIFIGEEDYVAFNDL